MIPIEKKRFVWANNATKNETHCKDNRASLNNDVRTTTYNGLATIPKLLLEAYSDVANCYFTFVVILMAIPQLPTPPYITTLVPLVLILIMGWAMDLWDDFRRRMSDRQINRTPAKRLEGNKWVVTPWESLVVGDIVHIDQEFPRIPGDVLVLDTSHETGFCFVESKDLDGETNLKRCKALTKHLNWTEQSLQSSKCEIECDAPNIDLLNFNGTWKDGTHAYSFTEEHVLLRGCSLQNTKYVRGILLYAGADTKQMKNCGKPRHKTTSLEQMTGVLVVKLALMMVGFAIISAIANSVWLVSPTWKRRGMNFLEAYGHPDEDFDADVNSFLMFWTYFALYSNLVPITLLVSVKTVRLLQSFFISYDGEMYHAETDCAAEAKSSNLTDQLGQIEFLLSDKTGTLTSNIMNFKKCTIKGIAYEPSETGPGGWVGPELAKKIDTNSENETNLFQILAVCHTVECETTSTSNEIEYKAESPDEKCLVEAARDVGIVFKGEAIDKDTGVANRSISFPNGVSKTFKILHTIKFNSQRKRMSTIVQTPDDKYMIYTKGADNIMEPLLTPASREFWESDNNNLTKWSREGLRTLVFAQRELSLNEYTKFCSDFEGAASADDSKHAQELVYRSVESGLTLVGCSAIEDKLQDGVPETIAKLKEAGIKVWVLTGDKQLTAIEIGKSCQLLSEDMAIHCVNGKTHDIVRQHLIKAKEAIHIAKQHSNHGLVIDGPTLALLLDDKRLEKSLRSSVGSTLKKSLSGGKKKLVVENTEQRYDQEHCAKLLLEVATECSAVICCRVTPLQKSMIVKLVRTTGKITCAVGDGANDVSMIRAAHIGVGISGLEGRQAVQASDYSIGQFRFLQRLLLVHGRWSYYRMTLFLKYFMYKNFVWNLIVFWHAFNNGSSGTLIFDPLLVTVFNVLYTLLPPMVVGVLDQDVDAKASVDFPILYQAGIRNEYFNNHIFYHTVLRGIFHSVIIYVFVGVSLYGGNSVTADGEDQADMQTVGFMFGAIGVVVANVEISLQLKNWQWLSAFSIFFGIVSFLMVTGTLHHWHNIINVNAQSDCSLCIVSPNYGVFKRVMSHANFYLTVVIVTAICLLPDHFFRLIQVSRYPTPVDYVRERTTVQSKSTCAISYDYPGAPPEKEKANDANITKRSTASGQRSHLKSIPMVPLDTAAQAGLTYTPVQILPTSIIQSSNV
eukprot:m.90042 g.90042  ORF g.90042 m.90042 type:complete len:1189 (-) comp26359_c0_seq1:156-3722(-)